MFDLFQPMHLPVILLVALAVFGPKRLIEVSRQAGHFVHSLQEYKEELTNELSSSSAQDEAEEKESSARNTSEKEG